MAIPDRSTPSGARPRESPRTPSPVNALWPEPTWNCHSRVDPTVTTEAGGSDSERQLPAARSQVDQDSDAPDGVIIDRRNVLICRCRYAFLTRRLPGS